MPTLFTSSLLAGLALASISSVQAAEPAHRHHAGHLMSPYADQENRAIKTFSDQDIDDLENGRGWGLAKAADVERRPRTGPSAGNEDRDRPVNPSRRPRSRPCSRP